MIRVGESIIEGGKGIARSRELQISWKSDLIILLREVTYHDKEL